MDISGVLGPGSLTIPGIFKLCSSGENSVNIWRLELIPPHSTHFLETDSAVELQQS